MPEAPTKEQGQRATLYVLEALSRTEREAFEQELEKDPALQGLVAEYRSTLDLSQKSFKLHPSPEYLQGQRNLLRGRIQQLEAKRRRRPRWTTIRDGAANLIQGLITTRQPAWAVVTYILVAFLAGRMILKAPPTESAQPDIRELIQSGALQNVDFDAINKDESVIQFALETSQEHRLQRDLNDPLTREILSYLLLHNANPGVRLKAVKLLNKAPVQDGDKSVFISALLSDPNPGVRLRALQMLQTYKSDDLLREACIKILLEDENEAVRLGALEILAQAPSDQLVPVLQVVSQMDDNPYIRAQAHDILEEIVELGRAEKIESLE